MNSSWFHSMLSQRANPMDVNVLMVLVIFFFKHFYHTRIHTWVISLRDNGTSATPKSLIFSPVRRPVIIFRDWNFIGNDNLFIVTWIPFWFCIRHVPYLA